MNKLRHIFLCLGTFLSAWAGGVDVQPSSTDIEIGPCLQSFGAFAFQANTPEETTLPDLLWQLETAIPPHPIEEYHEGELIHYYRGLNVALARSSNGRREFWITGQVGRGLEDTPIIIIYRPDLREWEFVSTDVEATGLYVKDLFLDRNGVVWGKNTWKMRQDYTDMENFPVLSRYNESRRRFEMAADVLEIPLAREILADNQITVMGDHETRIILDGDGVFWIFAQYDGLYRYDLYAQTTEKRADLPDIYVGSTVSSLDGTIYFSRSLNSGEGHTARELFTLTDGRLAQFTPETNAIDLVDTPDGWPIYSGLLFDSAGRLWLGSVGYREPNGIWHLIHPDPEAFFDHAGDYTWSLPYPVLESTNGVLWFKKFLDQGGGWKEGTAWYDPNTGEGCMFTHWPANIVEDSQQQLWLVADGNLYRYELNP